MGFCLASPNCFNGYKSFNLNHYSTYVRHLKSHHASIWKTLSKTGDDDETTPGASAVSPTPKLRPTSSLTTIEDSTGQRNMSLRQKAEGLSAVMEYLLELMVPPSHLSIEAFQRMIYINAGVAGCTADGWRDRFYGFDYMCITLQWYGPDFEFYSILLDLDVCRSDVKKSSDQIAYKISNTFEELGLDYTKIIFTTYSGSHYTPFHEP